MMQERSERLHLSDFRFRLASLEFVIEILAKDYLRTNVLIFLNSV